MSPVGNTSLANVISLDGIIGPISYSTDQNNFTNAELGSGNYLLLNPTANNKKFSGITAPAASINQVIFIMNVSTSNKTVLKNNSGSSTAANRFLFKLDISLEANEGCIVLYDHSVSRWRCIAKNI